jgi:peptide/nickel transport system permease protein
MIPTMTLIGVVMGSLLGGAAVIETVFTIPGLGRLLITSIYARDYVMVQGIMLLVATTYVLINLLIDVLYPLLDPRVRLER